MGLAMTCVAEAASCISHSFRHNMWMHNSWIIPSISIGCSIINTMWPPAPVMYDVVVNNVCLLVQCDAINGDVTHDTWRLRCSFPVYLIAMSATAGAAHQQLAAVLQSLLMSYRNGMSLCLSVSCCGITPGPRNMKMRNRSAPK